MRIVAERQLCPDCSISHSTDPEEFGSARFAVARVGVGFRWLAVVGISGLMYALPALEKALAFERLCVIGRPCSDNATSERFHQFLELISGG